MEDLDLKTIVGLQELAAQYIRMGEQLKALNRLIENKVPVSVTITPQPGTGVDLHSSLAPLNGQIMGPCGPRHDYSPAVGVEVMITMHNAINGEREQIAKVLRGANYQLKDVEAQIKEMTTCVLYKGGIKNV